MESGADPENFIGGGGGGGRMLALDNNQWAMALGP